MMVMRKNRHVKAQNGGLLPTSPIPFDFHNSAGKSSTDLSEVCSHGGSLFHKK